MKMKRKSREVEMGSSEIRSAIEELSNLVVLKIKPSADDGEDVVAHVVPIKPFLSICSLLIQVLDKIGPSMAVLRQDINQNIQRLEKFYQTDPLMYSNVVEILKKEVSEGMAKKGPTCSKSFVWLTRSLDFTVKLLQLIAEDFGRNMEQAVEESYNLTLKPWHGWISSTAYRVAIKLVPDTHSFVQILMAKYEDQNMLKKELLTFTSLFVPFLEELHNILKTYGLDRLKCA